MLKRILILLVRLSLAPTLLRELRQRRGVTILLYHSIEPEMLDRHLEALRRRYRFIALRDYLDARTSGTLRALPPKAMVLTLDDGHAANHGLLPVLRKHGVTATIFVCTRIVGTRRHFWFRDEAARGRVGDLLALPDGERVRRLAAGGFEEAREYPDRQALGWEEMEAMRDRVDFQSHTRLHPVLVHCDEARAREEIAASRTDLEEKGFPAYAFAYPNGDHSDREVRMAEESGYACALTADPGLNGAETPLYRLKRIPMRDEAGVGETLIRACGLWSAARLLLRGRA